MAAWQVFGLLLVGIAIVRTDRAAFSSFKAPKAGKVLEYQIFVPEVVWTSPNQLSVNLNSTAVQFTLQLYQNVGLLSTKFLSRFDTNIGQQATMGHDNCFYHGKVKGRPEWTVVLSTCLGLRGSFGPRGDSMQRYHIEPLHYRLGSQDLTQPHVLYHGSEYSSENGTCGATGHRHHPQTLSTEYHLIDKHRDHSSNRQFEEVRRQGRRPVVEWTLVNDHAQYLAFESNLTLVVLRAIEIANGVDEIYRVQGVRLVVVDVITWTLGDPITVTSDAGDFLDNFRDYSPNLPQHYDSAMLFTGTQFEGTTIGIAFTATMCELLRSAVGLVQDGGGELDQLISTTSHELGHIFAMDHDTDGCICEGEPSNTCIMQDVLGIPPPKTWSSCSVETLRNSLAGTQGLCLNDEPIANIKDAACGNGIQEKGEACDCGSATECTDQCCNSTSCQLVEDAECRAGPCCQDNCRFKEYGSVCRQEKNECDIQEYCTGDNSDCPKDFFLQDLTPCPQNKSYYCFSGDCQSRDGHCQHHFITNDAIDECYTLLNTQGNVYGHCGFDDSQYKPCLERNAFCGQIQCQDGGSLQTTPGLHVQFSLPSFSFTCNSVTTRAGSDEISPGLIRDGTLCGEGRVCVKAECVNVTSLDIPPCPIDGVFGEVCSDRGLCNNENKCSCSVGFTGSVCREVVRVGKQHKEVNGGVIAAAVIGCVIMLVVFGAVTSLIVHLVLQSKSSSFRPAERRTHEGNTEPYNSRFQPTTPIPKVTSSAGISKAIPTIQQSTSNSWSTPPQRPPSPSSKVQTRLSVVTNRPLPPAKLSHFATTKPSTLGHENPTGKRSVRT